LSIYKEKFFRNLGVIAEHEQEILRKTNVAIVGLGGTGGTAFECLLRLGVENFILFDRDTFELTNFNRQLLATDITLDQKKTRAALERAKNINSNTKIIVNNEFASKKIKKAKIVIDGTDNVETRISIAKACRDLRIPYVFSAASFSIGIVSIFTNYQFEKAFQLPKTKKELNNYNTCTSVIAPATMFAGTLAASQAINYILKKPFTEAPDALFFDLFSKEIISKKRLE